MDLITIVFDNLMAKMKATGLFSKVFGLSKLNEDGSYSHYKGAGQSELIGNFDNENGTVFFLARSGIPTNKAYSPNPCAGLYLMSIPVRAVAILRKANLPCDNAAAGFQFSAAMLKEFYGMDSLLMNELNATKVEISPVSMDDKLIGVNVGNEYAVGIADFNVMITTNIKCLPGLCPVE